MSIEHPTDVITPVLQLLERSVFTVPLALGRRRRNEGRIKMLKEIEMTIKAKRRRRTQLGILDEILMQKDWGLVELQ